MSLCGRGCFGVVALVLLAGCKESKQQQCSRIRGVVSEEMTATAAFGKAAATGPIPFGTHAVALRKASTGSGAVEVQDPALRHAVDIYKDATAKLAGAYETEATARDAGNLAAYGSSATVGIVYGSMLDQSRISIANACPD